VRKSVIQAQEKYTKPAFLKSVNMLHKGPSSKQCSNFRQSIFLPSLASFQSVQVRRPKVHVYSEGSGAVVTNFISLQVSRLSTKTCRIIIKKHNAIINQRIHRRVGESGRVSYYFWLSVKCTFCGSTKFSSSELRDHASSSGSKSIFLSMCGVWAELGGMTFAHINT